MAVVRRLGLFLFGFALATLAAAFFHVPSAFAQEATQQRKPDPIDPADAYVAAPTRASPNRRSPDSPASDPATAYETQPRRILRDTTADGDVSDGDIDAETTSDDPDQANGADADPLLPRSDASDERGGERPLTDGDLSAPVDQNQPADGVVDLSDPVPLQDGADPSADTRPQEDLDVFNQPPAGFDPLLFQIEDIDPIETDRRPLRLHRFEPYDPIGIKVGSFVYFPEIEVAGRWTDNVLNSPDARADIAAEILTTSRLVSNWSVHALELKGTSLTSFHDEFPSEDDRAWSAEARGRLDFTRRTNLQGLVSHSKAQESRTAIDASDTGERADITTDTAELSLNHRFNRLSVNLRGSVSDMTYSDTDGASNRDRDTLETRETVRAAWEFKPTFSVFAEQELNQRDKVAAPADGVPRDSEGTRTRVGLDFGATGAVLRGEVSLGYGRQTPRDDRLKPVDTLLFDANLVWRPSEVTSFLLTANTDIFETTTTNSGGVASHTAGLELRHAFRRYLIATTGVLYTHYNYSGVDIEESELTSYAGLEYYASPELVLFTRYQHLDYASNQADADYESDEIRFGVRVRR